MKPFALILALSVLCAACDRSDSTHPQASTSSPTLAPTSTPTLIPTLIPTPTPSPTPSPTPTMSPSYQAGYSEGAQLAMTVARNDHSELRVVHQSEQAI